MVEIFVGLIRRQKVVNFTMGNLRRSQAWVFAVKFFYVLADKGGK